MNGKRFDQIVEARAKQRAEAIVNKFVNDVRNALIAVDHGLTYCGNIWEDDLAKSLLAQLTNLDRRGRIWPEKILDMQREQVKNELLSVMDEMQKAIIAADNFKPEATFGKSNETQS